MIPDAALVAALMRDQEFRYCVKAAEQSPASAYVAKDFNFRPLSLSSGERLVIAVGKNQCGWQGQAARVLIYARTQSGYRLVLNDFSLPEEVVAKPDGAVYLAAHETMDTLLESTFIWNGTKYAFSPERSSVYCVGPQRDNRTRTSCRSTLPPVLRRRFCAGPRSRTADKTIRSSRGPDSE